MKKNLQVSKKTKIAKVHLKGEIVEMRRLAQGINTQKEAAIKIGCDVRTYQRAINGDPILLRIAKKICDGLKIDLKEVLIIELGNNLFPVDEEEKDTEEFSDLRVDAIMAAGEAIQKTFESRQSSSNVQDLIIVLSAVISTYSLEIAKKSRGTALYFVDEIAHKAKTALYSEISVIDGTTESP